MCPIKSIGGDLAVTRARAPENILTRVLRVDISRDIKHQRAPMRNIQGARAARSNMGLWLYVIVSKCASYLRKLSSATLLNAIWLMLKRVAAPREALVQCGAHQSTPCHGIAHIGLRPVMSPPEAARRRKPAHRCGNDVKAHVKFRRSKAHRRGTIGNNASTILSIGKK